MICQCDHVGVVDFGGNAASMGQTHMYYYFWFGGRSFYRESVIIIHENIFCCHRRCRSIKSRTLPNKGIVKKKSSILYSKSMSSRMLIMLFFLFSANANLSMKMRTEKKMQLILKLDFILATRKNAIEKCYSWRLCGGKKMLLSYSSHR